MIKKTLQKMNKPNYTTNELLITKEGLKNHQVFFIVKKPEVKKILYNFIFNCSSSLKELL